MARVELLSHLPLQKYASLGKRVLFVGQEPTPTLSLLLGANISPEPTEIDSNLKAVNIQAASLLESGWEELKTRS